MTPHSEPEIGMDDVGREEVGVVLELAVRRLGRVESRDDELDRKSNREANALSRCFFLRRTRRQRMK
jgi:hypothetical protein